MTSYPGETPPQPDGQRPEEPAPQVPDDATEPTQPVGYWERQAAERAREQEQQGHPQPTTAYPQEAPPVFNPTTAQPGYQPYSQPSAQQYNQPYAQPYSQPYSQPGAPPPPGGQSAPTGGTPGYPYGAFTPPRTDHPQATLALVLGIIGLAGGFVCGIGFLAAPFAWALGRRALKDIAASGGRLGGDGSARAGMVMGIIGTVLLALAVVVLALLIVVGLTTSTTSGSDI